MKEHAESKTTKVLGHNPLDVAKLVEDLKRSLQRLQELQEFAGKLQEEALLIEDCQSPSFRERLSSKSWHGNSDRDEKDYGNCKRCNTVLEKRKHARGFCKPCYAKIKRTGAFDKYIEPGE